MEICKEGWRLIERLGGRRRLCATAIDLGRFDAVVLSEIIWYLLEDMDGVFAKVSAALEPGGVLGVHQFFPTVQRYGKDVLDGVHGFEQFMTRNRQFTPIKTALRPAADGAVLLATYAKEE